MKQFVYPRLPMAAAIKQLDDVRAAYRRGGLDAVVALAGPSHPKASPVPTGGTPVDEEQCHNLRATVLSQISPAAKRLGDSELSVSEFDRILGGILYDELKILPADASYDETWSFLSLCLFPDICCLRFPDMHADRFMGSARNALRRTWMRHEVLGDLITTSANPLGEDELVGLFERTSLARNRNLLRVLATEVMAYEGKGRSIWARKLYVRATYSTGSRLLDILDDSELGKIVKDGALHISKGR
ncbi:hypothetical protein ACXVUM_13200 [Williamsia sp. SKLECPSW1]